MGAGTSGGGYGVMSDVFGGANYTTSINGAHVHAIITDTRGNHAHQLYWAGNHVHNVYGVGDHVHGIYGDGIHAHNVWSGGSGTRLEVVQPVMVVSKIIYAGIQAAPAARPRPCRWCAG